MITLPHPREGRAPLPVERLLVATIAACLACLPAAALAQPTFQGIGIGTFGPDVGVASHATAVSADGTTVVGSNTYVDGGQDAIRWTQPGGMALLGREMEIRGSGQVRPVAPSPGYEALAVSGDGTVASGRGAADGAFHWHAAGGLITAAPVVDAVSPVAVSGDGLTFAGGIDNLGVSVAPYLWTDAGGAVYPQIDGVASGTMGSFNDLSADGSVAVGWVGHLTVPFAGRPVVRWSAATGFQQMVPDAPDLFGTGQAVSPDGRFVVGRFGGLSESQAFLWDSQADTVQYLGDLGAGPLDSIAHDVSADGGVVVGRSSSGAFVWDEANGMRLLLDVLTNELGLDLTGWSLDEATGISADGLVIVGNGVNPSGQDEGWVVTLVPEPGTGTLVGLGLALLGARRRRRGAV